MEKEPVDMLRYPNMKADLSLCREQLYELCQGTHDKAIMSVPPRPTDFDMNLDAALDELQAFRNTGLTPEQVAELVAKATPKEVIPHVTDESFKIGNVRFGKGVTIWNCPSCGAFTMRSHSYCEKCGQALKWPEPPKEE